MKDFSKLPFKKGVIVGSQALGFRMARDIDVVCWEKDIQTEYAKTNPYITSFNWEGLKVECLLADEMEHLQRLLEYTPYKGVYPTSYKWLYILKAGHIHLPHPKWDVHIHDYHILRKIITTSDCTIPDDIISIARKENNKIAQIKTPRLKGISKEKFFDDNVVKTYDHDNIHKCVAHKDKPMYEYMQRPQDEVECQRYLWDEFSVEDKINTVQEECYVIALERFLIPRYDHSPFNAFKRSLYKVCTTLCSGWFREFAINNYYYILNTWDSGYVKRFEDNIEKYEERKHKCLV